ncbi:unnamed protein product [Mycena citricolor]|uniref:ornithine decarboxylase n=1 Tax=Mycena citricolor TaxID=2018698 RepID=A0AAD2H9J5_9AGAR|nr:unnamed protein product [Mycena citricolor]
MSLEHSHRIHHLWHPPHSMAALFDFNAGREPKNGRGAHAASDCAMGRLPPLHDGHPDVHLHNGALAAPRLAAENKTNAEGAFYVADLSEVYRQHVRWTAALPEIQPHYAVKCNPDPYVLRLLAALGAGFDCASDGEISQVLAMGTDPSRIIFANPCKAQSSVQRAAKAGVALLTFDNTDELHKIAAAHPHAQLVVRILADDTRSSSQLGTKFGAALADVPGLLADAQALGLNVVGVSFHVGSGCTDPRAYIDAVARARTAFDIGASAGYAFSLLDVGGGFIDALFEDAARCLMEGIDRYFPQRLGKVKLIAEPGRYYVSNAFRLATSIIARRAPAVLEGADMQHDVGRPAVKYYISDGVYGAFNCLIFDPHIARPAPYVLRMSGASDTETALVTCSLWGPTCDSVDCVAESILLPRALRIGDWLVFENMGAYTISASSRFNGFACSVARPPTLPEGPHPIPTDSNNISTASAEEFPEIASAGRPVLGLGLGDPSTTQATRRQSPSLALHSHPTEMHLNKRAPAKQVVCFLACLPANSPPPLPVPSSVPNNNSISASVNVTLALNGGAPPTVFRRRSIHRPRIQDSPLPSTSSSQSPRFRPFACPSHPIAKGRYITSNDPRGYIPVYEYPLNGQWIMMDIDDGYILWTGIWKALGNSKADIVKMVDSQPELASVIRRVRGGYLKIQGTWMPYETALRLARRVAWNIREDLVPLFGPTFPGTCLSPDQPGYGQIVANSGRRRARRVVPPPPPREAGTVAQLQLHAPAPAQDRPAPAPASSSTHRFAPYPQRRSSWDMSSPRPPLQLPVVAHNASAAPSSKPDLYALPPISALEDMRGGGAHALDSAAVLRRLKLDDERSRRGSIGSYEEDTRRASYRSLPALRLCVPDDDRDSNSNSNSAASPASVSPRTPRSPGEGLSLVPLALLEQKERSRSFSGPPNPAWLSSSSFLSSHPRISSCRYEAAAPDQVPLSSW